MSSAEPLNPAYYEFLLAPSPSQRDLLDDLLAGPTLLQRLIALYGSEIRTLEDASNFLNTNWRRLADYMFTGSVRKSPKNLELLILSMATSGSTGFSLDFTSGFGSRHGMRFFCPFRGSAK